MYKFNYNYTLKSRALLTGRIWKRPYPLNGLVLHLPLWHPELTGSTIISKDLNAHSCEVTGTTWGIQGRAFDGDDIIITPTVAVGSGIFTMSCVVSVPSLSFGSYGLMGGPMDYMGLSMVPEGFNVGKSAVAAGTTVAYTIPWNTFLRVTAIAISATQGNIYVNGVFIGTSTVAACTLGNRLFNLGAASSVADIPFTGKLGEAQAWNYGLSVPEIMKNHLITKWRY